MLDLEWNSIGKNWIHSKIMLEEIERRQLEDIIIIDS